MARKKTLAAEGEGAASFQAFADDDTALTIGGLTIENGQERVSISGSADIAADKTGLAQARALQQALGSIIAALEAKGDLPDEASASPAVTKPTKTRRNPFA